MTQNILPVIVLQTRTSHIRKGEESFQTRLSDTGFCPGAQDLRLFFSYMHSNLHLCNTNANAAEEKKKTQSFSCSSYSRASNSALHTPAFKEESLTSFQGVKKGSFWHLTRVSGTSLRTILSNMFVLFLLSPPQLLTLRTSSPANSH